MRNLSEEMLAKASAYYVVTYDQNLGEDRNGAELLSFPWISVSDLLGIMKERATYHVDAYDDCPAAEKLEESMIKDVQSESIFGGSGIPAATAKYLRAYPSLERLILVLVKWARQKKLLKPDVISVRNFVGIVLFHCLENRFIEPPTAFGATNSLPIGEMCIKILREWSGAHFKRQGISFNSLQRQLSPGDLDAFGFTGNLKSKKLMKLHMAAFDTFHSVAISGDFGPLLLSGPRKRGRERDSREFNTYQLVIDSVSHSVLISMFRGETEGDMGSIKQKLCEATGMTALEIRVEKFPHCVNWFVSGNGELDAQRKLKNLLVQKDCLFQFLNGQIGAEEIDLDY